MMALLIAMPQTAPNTGVAERVNREAQEIPSPIHGEANAGIRAGGGGG